MSHSHSPATVNPHLASLEQHIVCVRSALTELKDKSGAVDEAALLGLQQQLHAIEKHKHEGIWCGNLHAAQIPEGQAKVQEKFQECMDLVEQLQARDETPAAAGSDAAPAPAAAVSGSTAAAQQAAVASFMASVTSSVQAVLNELTHEGARASPAAVTGFQKHLRVIEGHKKDGIWCGSLRAGVIPEGQAELNELFEKASALADEMAAKVQ